MDVDCDAELLRSIISEVTDAIEIGTDDVEDGGTATLQFLPITWTSALSPTLSAYDLRVWDVRKGRALRCRRTDPPSDGDRRPICMY